MKRSQLTFFALIMVASFLIIGCTAKYDQGITIVDDTSWMPDETETGEYVEEITGLLECEYEIWEGIQDNETVISKYEDAIADGKEEGYTPIIIIPSANMIEVLKLPETMETYDYGREPILERAQGLSAAEVFSELEDFWAEEDKEEFIDEFSDVYVEYPAQTIFSCTEDMWSQKPYRHLILAKLPTMNPWEAAAWIPMGGFNYCPLPEEQVAVFKYWNESYGAIPAVVGYDQWELYLPEPVTSIEDSEKIAWEQFVFCVDIVMQGWPSVGDLAGYISGSNTWQFWWD